eukprot:CFRG1178T1
MSKSSGMAVDEGVEMEVEVDKLEVPQQMASFMDFIRVAVLSSEQPSIQATEQKAKQVTDFFYTPLQLEKLISFGWWMCLDTFLFTFTVLPLRVLLAVGQQVFTFVTFTRKPLSTMQLCDILRLAIVVIVSGCLQLLDASKIYHVIRSQDTIKLYVIFNVLEIIEKYCSWLGQDILDALFSRQRVKRIFCVAILYTLLHSLVCFCQVMTLQVAINSHSRALLTMLLSNQFVELKGNVFKKYGREQVYKIACYDIVERFYLITFLSMIAMRNLKELNWSWHQLDREAYLFLGVMMSEVFVDWIKHAFLSKFNGFAWVVYQDLRDDLAQDLVFSHVIEKMSVQSNAHKRKFIDQSHLVSRRIGFVGLPIACVFVRITMQSMPTISASFTGVLLGVLTWLCLLMIKLLLSIVMLGASCGLVRRQRLAKQQQQNHRTVMVPSGTSRMGLQHLMTPPISHSIAHVTTPTLARTAGSSVSKEYMVDNTEIVSRKESLSATLPVSRKPHSSAHTHTYTPRLLHLPTSSSKHMPTLTKINTTHMRRTPTFPLTHTSLTRTTSNGSTSQVALNRKNGADAGVGIGAHRNVNLDTNNDNMLNSRINQSNNATFVHKDNVNNRKSVRRSSTAELTISNLLSNSVPTSPVLLCESSRRHSPASLRKRRRSIDAVGDNEGNSGFIDGPYYDNHDNHDNYHTDKTDEELIYTSAYENWTWDEGESDNDLEPVDEDSYASVSGGEDLVSSPHTPQSIMERSSSQSKLTPRQSLHSHSTDSRSAIALGEDYIENAKSRNEAPPARTTTANERFIPDPVLLHPKASGGLPRITNCS